MSSNVERGQDARLRGNAFYKAYQFSNAIKAYKVAAALTPSDPAPLSNLSAVTFETGDYEKSVQFSTDALALLAEEPDDDPRKQKLLTRLTKAKRYQSEPDDSIPKQSLRDTTLYLPRYRPSLTNDRAYYPIGHDDPESLYRPALERTTKDAKVVSFMFCGVGDARNMLQTILEYSPDPMKPYNSRKADQKLHMTILDVSQAIIARDLILFALLDDISLIMSMPDEEKLRPDNGNPYTIIETLDTISYFYMASVMPAYAWNRIRGIIQRLLDAFDNSKQPISWVHIPPAAQAAVRPSLEAWKRGPTECYSTKIFREATQEGYLQTRMGVMSMSGGMDLESQLSFSHLKFDQRAFKDMAIVLPDDDLLAQHDPQVVAIIEAYRKKVKGAQERLSSHIDKTWKPNITLVDVVFESENTKPGCQPRPDLGISPFQVLGSLMKDTAQAPAVLGLETLIMVAENYFMTMGGAIASLRDCMMVEVCVGEMADRLERIQYQILDRPTETKSNDFLLSSKWPHKYHMIHMSNVPDYVGGPFTAFLYAHWISNLIDSILSGVITTNARPPSRVVLTTGDVDTAHPTQSFCTKPWLMEFATLIGLWRSILPVGIVVPSAVPRVDDIMQYTVKFPGLKIWDARAPHSMLVFHNEQKFGELPKKLRSILINDINDNNSKSKALKDCVRCMSTFRWSFKAEEATFWISKDAFEEMKEWVVSVWRTDSWEQEGKGVKLGKSVVKTKCWGEWEDSLITM
ncbi:uncharacterized protein MELLADRAFT_85814 [Melampsora larici-populina 98AG31]|uniref:DUF4470 domain-containing protein n=1 Tax=Melampsora larici-populina (strain 98AG31 / pathotype 3-4-7) TaxID=747676 RepID=F4RJV8_MELLP|nr:uncharacterized protein MELLADRAFT_85814 [Melampsora larici-populina 98AG31]EGG07380.1 hypothetical protein MELLADRAFT_85814 [Melampsora larici-populina 98AG31]